LMSSTTFSKPLRDRMYKSTPNLSILPKVPCRLDRSDQEPPTHYHWFGRLFNGSPGTRLRPESGGIQCHSRRRASAFVNPCRSMAHVSQRNRRHLERVCSPQPWCIHYLLTPNSFVARIGLLNKEYFHEAKTPCLMERTRSRS
jgi:hypothetical protein